MLALAMAMAVGAGLFLRSGTSKQPIRPADARAADEHAADEGTAREPAASRAPGVALARPPASTDRCARERCEPCPTGMRPEEAPGECCPRCVAADQKACDGGRQRYEDRYAELEAELRGCASDDDCTVASFSDACRASCPLPLNKTALGAVVAKLSEAAALNCQACAPQPFACPRQPSDTARCVGGRCEFGLPAPR